MAKRKCGTKKCKAKKGKTVRDYDFLTGKYVTRKGYKSIFA
jgi:hypothetical protein